MQAPEAKIVAWVVEGDHTIRQACAHFGFAPATIQRAMKRAGYVSERPATKWRRQ